MSKSAKRDASQRILQRLLYPVHDLQCCNLTLPWFNRYSDQLPPKIVWRLRSQLLNRLGPRGLGLLQLQQALGADSQRPVRKSRKRIQETTG